MVISVFGLQSCNGGWGGNRVKGKEAGLISGFRMNLFFLGSQSCRAWIVVLLQLLIQ